jgi:hypothetical protein
MRLLGGVDQHSETIGESNWKDRLGGWRNLLRKARSHPGAVEPVVVMMMMKTMTMMMIIM